MLSSLQLLTPSPTIQSNKRLVRAASTQGTPVTEPVRVDVSRLEPRVEERDGYWVLKEKYREKINQQEKIKLEKDPMKLFTEGGIHDLAKLSWEEIENSKLNKDDIDFRLKWLGLFHRRKQQCKFVFRFNSFSLVNFSHLVSKSFGDPEFSFT